VGIVAFDLAILGVGCEEVRLSPAHRPAATREARANTQTLTTERGHFAFMARYSLVTPRCWGSSVECGWHGVQSFLLKAQYNAGRGRGKDIKDIKDQKDTVILSWNHYVLLVLYVLSSFPGCLTRSAGPRWGRGGLPSRPDSSRR
jgi:hypothetical protein